MVAGAFVCTGEILRQPQAPHATRILERGEGFIVGPLDLGVVGSRSRTHVARLVVSSGMLEHAEEGWVRETLRDFAIAVGVVAALIAAATGIWNTYRLGTLATKDDVRRVALCMIELHDSDDRTSMNCLLLRFQARSETGGTR